MLRSPKRLATVCVLTVALALSGLFWRALQPPLLTDAPPAISTANSTYPLPTPAPSTRSPSEPSALSTANATATPSVTPPAQRIPADPADWPTPTALNWPDARILSVDYLPASGNHPPRHSILIAPAHLPFPVRIDRDANFSQRSAPAREYVANRLLLRLQPGIAPASIQPVLDALDARILDFLPSANVLSIELPTTDLDSYHHALGTLNAQPQLLAFAENDFIQRILTVRPNDPLFTDGSLWHYENTGQRAANDATDPGVFGTADADADLPEAWAIRSDASDVIVAVIDTGIFYTHEDLQANMWLNAAEANGLPGVDDDHNGVIDDVHGLNAITDLGDPLDDNRHGTHVAGIIGASANNTHGGVGVAWNVQLLAAKFAAADGTGATSDALQAIDYAVRMGADVINLSYGSPFFSEAALETLLAASNAGTLIVCAAGNFGWDVDEAAVYPAGYFVENLVSVAATDRRDQLAEFSNRSQGLVHIAAPGVSIFSSVIDPNAPYKAENGTSMAAPMLSGTLALLRAEFPEDAPAALVNRILNGSDIITSLHSATLTGGRLNVAKALAPNPANARPFNDDFADRKVLNKPLSFVRLQNANASTEPAEPIVNPTFPNSLWLSYTPASAGRVTMDLRGSSVPLHVSAFTGDALDALVSIPVTNPEGPLPEFPCLQGVTYQIALSTRPQDQGLLVASIAGPPINNDLKDATLLEGLSAFGSGTLQNATIEPSEPLHAGVNAAASVWWKWIAPASTRVALSTRGLSNNAATDTDTLLAVYNAALPAPSVAQLRPVAANDDEPGFPTSRLTFDAIQGQSYFFAVAAKGPEGPVSIRLMQPPANDDFTNAVPLQSSLPLSVSGSTLNASREAGEPNHHGLQGGFSVWYRFTPSADARLQIDTVGSLADTVLAVYTGNAVDALSRVTSDNDSGPANAARVIFDAQRNTTYFIAIDYLDAFFGADVTLNIQSVQRPPNDDFADRARLEGTRLTTRGTTVGASRERFDPGNNPSVWFQWQAPSSGRFAIHLDSLTGWRTFLSVHQGTALDALSLVAEDRSSAVGRDAFLEFDAVGGQSYNFQILAENGESGEFDLALRPASDFRPANDDLRNATALHPNQPLFAFPTANFAATSEPDEPSHAGMNGRRSLWWKVTAHTDATFAFSTAGSEPDQVGIAVYTAANPLSPQHNALSLVTSNATDPDSFYSEVSWQATANTSFFIAVDAMKEPAVNDGSGRIYAAFQSVPAHDDFAHRLGIPPHGGTFRAFNFGTSKELGEPTPDGTTAVRSLWWSFTPEVSGIYQIDTFGSRYFAFEDTIQHRQRGTLERGLDTKLGIYSGTQLHSLLSLAENDSYTLESYDLTFSTNVRNSRIILNLQAGTQYHVLVNTENVTLDNRPNGSATGEVVLNVQHLPPPPNDDFANATPVHGDAFIQRTADNSGATRQPGEPNHGALGTASLWWKWTAPRSGSWHAASSGRLFDNDAVRDSTIAVYTGASLDSLHSVARDNDSAGVNWNSSGLASFEATAGVTYFFAVDAVGSERGTLSFILCPTPPNDTFANATLLHGSQVVATGFNVGASNDPGQPAIESFPDGVFRNPFINLKSVWWKWVAPASGPVNVSTFGSQTYTVLGIYTGNAPDSLVPIAVSNSGDPFNGFERARTGTSQLAFNATVGQHYVFLVQGAGLHSTSAGPITLSVDAPPGIPAPPSSFFATRLNPTSARLDWAHTDTETTTFRIEFSPAGDAWHPLALLDANTNAFIDRSAPPANAQFRIRAEGPGGHSQWLSTTLTVRTPLDTWSLAFFGSLDPVDLRADPDYDGLPNALEWLFGSHPLQPDADAYTSALLIQPALHPQPNALFNGSLTFVPDALSAGTFSIQFSPNAQQWQTLWHSDAPPANPHPLSINDTTFNRIVWTLSNASGFFRLTFAPNP